MNDILAYFSIRTFFMMFSTAFSLSLVLLALNIISVEDVISLLNLSPEVASAFKTVASKIQEVTGNIVDIAAQLLNKSFKIIGVDLDLGGAKIDPNSISKPAISGAK